MKKTAYILILLQIPLLLLAQSREMTIVNPEIKKHLADFVDYSRRWSDSIKVSDYMIAMKEEDLKDGRTEYTLTILTDVGRLIKEGGKAYTIVDKTPILITRPSNSRLSRSDSVFLMDLKAIYARNLFDSSEYQAKKIKEFNEHVARNPDSTVTLLVLKDDPKQQSASPGRLDINKRLDTSLYKQEKVKVSSLKPAFLEPQIIPEHRNPMKMRLVFQKDKLIEKRFEKDK
jgi:hypothetical protein